MIKDNKNNTELYKGSNERLNRVLDIIGKNDFSYTENGKYYIDGESLFCILTDYKTRDEKDCFFESHKKYIDVHYCLAGDEIISVVDKWDLEIKEDYDEMSEAYILEGKSKNRMELKKSEFLILFPEDAHMTALKGQQDFVKKLIFKVEI